MLRRVRAFVRGRGPVGRGRACQFLFPVFLGLAAAAFLIHCFNASLRPQLVALAEAQVLNRLTLISDQAVSEALSGQALSYSDMVIVQTGQNGDVTTLSTDTVRLNGLRAEVLDRIVEQVVLLDSDSLNIPFGALTGIDLFAALGPRLPVKVVSVASARGTYENEFSDAGINQTLHRVLLNVEVTVRLLFPGGIETIPLSVPVCVAETVIVGQVPQTYLNWTDSP